MEMAHESKNEVVLKENGETFRIAFADCIQFQIMRLGHRLNVPTGRGMQIVEELNTGRWLIRDEDFGIMFDVEKTEENCVIFQNAFPDNEAESPDYVLKGTVLEKK